MGYTKIIGTPVITGLYTILLPSAGVCCLWLLAASRGRGRFGDSRHRAAGLATLAIPAGPHYVALTSLVALVAGGMLLVARVFRLGFLADFLSGTVLVGFLTGVGVQVALTQFPGCSASTPAVASSARWGPC